MNKTIHDPQLKEFIEKLKGITEDWKDHPYSFDAGYCAIILQEAIDNYLHQPELEDENQLHPL